MRYFSRASRLYRLHKLLILALLASGPVYSGDTRAESLYVLVNKNNQLQSISRDEIDNIFLGRINSYSNGDEVYLVTQRKNSHQHQAFLNHVVGKSEREWRSHWARLLFTGRGKAPKEVEGMEEMLQLIADKENAIGYVVATNLQQQEYRVILEIPLQ